MKEVLTNRSVTVRATAENLALAGEGHENSAMLCIHGVNISRCVRWEGSVSGFE